MKIKIDKLDNQGRGMAYLNDKPIFVSKTLPNEIVDIDIISEKSKFAIGNLKEIIEKNDKRVVPRCPYYNDCGGCNIMHLSYNEQLQYKQEKIETLITKILKEDIKINNIIPSNQFYYRNKVTFHVKESIGLYKEKTYEIISINKCMIVDEKINKVLDELRNKNLEGIYEIIVRTSKKEIMVIIKATKKINIDLNVDSIIECINNDYQIIKGKNFITEEIEKFKFIISPESFFQVNSNQMINLYNKVLEYLELKTSDEVLDLYCGTGTIGLWVSKYCKKVYGIEINESAIMDANLNKELNNVKNIEFKCDTTSNIDNNKFNKIIVDPPRNGLDKRTINYLINNDFERIVYVSCEPITLVRDLNILKEKYEILEITPVDMFPNTYHCESVVILERK